MKRSKLAHALATAAALTAVAMPAAHAAPALPASEGGGCATTGPLQACIHAAADTTLIPDSYQLADVPGCTSMQIEVTNRDESVTYSRKPVSTCSGHQVGQPTTTDLHGYFHAVVTAFDANSQILVTARSPEISG